ncbi:hypothetical protein [Thermus phage P23-45]|uniref:Uncharacterized protein n=1 Tax=Thermus virus P23-45 TaxID=2914006 RepID=A7XXA6_BP234|nr:holin [Thermus phage P23-45]ABU96908.1 hypothetical protein P23p75 [Thermus phage P23-45]UYB98401.1 hypothetical protein [Thermus phage P23-45]
MDIVQGVQISPLGRELVVKLVSGGTVKMDGLETVYVMLDGTELQIPEDSPMWRLLRELKRELNRQMDRPVSFAGGDW